jgi:hypothetical protein
MAVGAKTGRSPAAMVCDRCAFQFPAIPHCACGTMAFCANESRRTRMSYRRRGPIPERPVDDKPGNIYYVRLKTPVGRMYKLGFTTQSSVQDRLSFNGAGDEQQIDQVLVFAHHRHGLYVEQRLHRHFQNRAAFFSREAHLPLAANGQSELYVEDVLGLDACYTLQQAISTRTAILRAHLHHDDKTPDQIDATLAQKDESDDVYLALQSTAQSKPIALLISAFKAFNSLLFTTPAQEARQDEIFGYIQWLKNRQYDEAIQRQIRIRQMCAEYERLFGEKPPD